MAPTQKCPLCGGAFDPRCGFGFPREERGLAGMIRKALLRLGRSS